MCTSRSELLTIISIFSTSFNLIDGFTFSSFSPVTSFTPSFLGKQDSGPNIYHNLNRKKRKIQNDKILFYNTLEEASFVNDTLATSGLTGTEATSEQQQTIETSEKAAVTVPDLVNSDASSEQQALKILNDFEVGGLVSDILPPAPQTSSISEETTTSVETPSVIEEFKSTETPTFSFQSPELLNVEGELHLVNSLDEVSDIITPKEEEAETSSKIPPDLPDEALSIPTSTSSMPVEDINGANNILVEVKTIELLDGVSQVVSPMGEEGSIISAISPDTIFEPPTSASNPSEEAEQTNNVPNVRNISRFAIAALGVWLCSPILSMIDTSAVGLLSGTAQQAALNPAVSVTEYTALLIAFMYTGTTNLIASAQEQDRVDQSNRKTASAFRASLQLSTYVGATLGVSILFSASTLLRMIIGRNNSGLDPVVFAAALKYVKIRALGMPAAAITGSAQAACLGMKDTKSPLLILLMAASINLIGDIVLVGNSNPWIGGAAGAAWATVFSQYAAMFMFTSFLTKSKTKMDVDNFDARFQKFSPLNRLRKLFRTQNLTKGNSSVSATKGLLAGMMSKRTLLKFPPLDVTKQFSPYFLPVTTTSAGRVSAYVAMAHVISSAIGTSAMAAQQIILSFFFCLCPVADAISLTAQSYVPAFMERINQVRGSCMENAKALRKLTLNLMKASVFFALGSVGVVSSMPFLSRFFTADPVVLSQVRSITPFVAAVFSFHAITMAAEGILLGRKDLAFLGKSYAFYFFVIPTIYLKMKEASLAGLKTVTLATVWQVFVLYGLSRVFLWNLRLIQQTCKTMHIAKKNSVTTMENGEEIIFG